MSKIILPVSLNPISRRKDKSVKLSLETRELTPEETLILMAIEGTEGWMCLSPNENELETPNEPVHLEGKSISERIRASMYVWYKKLTEQGQYIGTFDNFYKEKGEKLIEFVKKQIPD